MCRYGRYDRYNDYEYRYPRYKHSVDCCDLDLRPGDPIKVMTGCVVKIGIFICTDGRLLTWIDNAGNKSFSPLDHITITKLHGCGMYRCSDECPSDGCNIE